MSEDAKQFIFGLEQCRQKGGMKWGGKIPPEIIELFDVNIGELNHGYTISGVYVQTVPRYQIFTPEWNERRLESES